jgi:tetratricopeptide (TPR) repeat protein
MEVLSRVSAGRTTHYPVTCPDKWGERAGAREVRVVQARSPAPTEFGPLLRQLRIAAELSQEQLAERARMSADAVGALERGRRRAPQRETVDLLLAALELQGKDREALLAAASRGRLRRGGPAVSLPRSIVDASAVRPVPGFIGRDRELKAVHAALASDVRVAVIHGLSGVGKSSIAREYASRYHPEYSIVWWLNAQTEEGIIESLLRLGALLTRSFDQIPDRRAAAQRVTGSMLSGFAKPVLLVFDNLEHERLLRIWLPQTSSRALVTSRSASWSADVTAIALDTWSLEAAIGYLQLQSGRTDLSEAGARAIAEALGTLPLALSHAAAVLRGMQMVTPQRYLERVAAYVKAAPHDAEYPNSVFATFSTAIAQAEHQAAGAAAVLCFAALFASDAIPDELFRAPAGLCPPGLQPVVSGQETLDLRSVLGDDLQLDEALGALDRLSLLTFAHRSRTYNMHRLVQLASKDFIGAASRAWHEYAVHVVNSVFPEVEFATWPQCERVLAHARAALAALAEDEEPIAAASLAERCSVYLQERGESAAAESLSARALSIREKVMGPDHVDVAKTVNNLANVYWYQGRYAEAESLYVRALTIWEQALGADHPDVARSLNNLAVVVKERGRHAEAESLYVRALAIREKALGADHPDVAYTLNNLANVYAEQGRYAEAEPLHRHALAISEKALGPNHPDVARSLNNLANVYRDQGRYAEAEPVHLRALAIWEKALGPDHPHVSHSLENLALTYRRQGRYQEVEPLLSRALSIREKALGPEHPLTKATREALGESLTGRRYERD